MKVFEFENRTLDFQIAGKQFTVICDDDKASKLREYYDGGKSLLAELPNKNKTREELIEFFKELIDSILGESAFDIIFENRQPNTKDCTDLALFLINEVGAEYRRISAKYKQNDVTPKNRAQRRAAARKK